MKQNNLKVAITGGIGSGKSAVAKIVSEQGFPVFSCDQTYAELLSDRNFLNRLCEEFGNVLKSDGTLDRLKLSSLVFSDGEKLKKLDSITHPAIFAEMFRRAAEKNCTCFFEVPLLFEGGYENLFDKIIVVLRDLDKRVESVKMRDNLTENQINDRIKSQFDYDNSDFAMYYVIHNNSNFADLRSETHKILNKIKQL